MKNMGGINIMVDNLLPDNRVVLLNGIKPIGILNLITGKSVFFKEDDKIVNGMCVSKSTAKALKDI